MPLSSSASATSLFIELQLNGIMLALTHLIASLLTIEFEFLVEHVNEQFFELKTTYLIG